MLNVYETNYPNARRFVRTVANVDEFLDLIPIEHIEEDNDYPGYYDAFSSGGLLYVLEPASRGE